MNREDYKRMSTSDAFINGDFKDSVTGGHNGLPLVFGGAEILITDDVKVPTGKGSLYYSFKYIRIWWSNGRVQ